MKAKKISKGLRLVIASLIIIAVVTMLVWVFPFVRQLEEKTIDLRSRLFPNEAKEAPIVLVTIDDISFDQINLRWPWPRWILASAIDELGKAGAAVVGLDIMMGEAGFSPEFDQFLAEVLGNHGNVVLPMKRDARIDDEFIVDYFDMPLPIFTEVAASIGFINLIQDSDGYVRRILKEDSSLGFPQQPFSLKILELYKSKIGSPEELLLPPSGDNTFLINYSNPGAFETIPFYQILSGDYEPEKIKDAIVLIGAYFKESHDLFFTPMQVFTAESEESGLYGMEVHANAINTLMGQNFLIDTPQWIDTLLTLFIIVFASFVLVRLRPTLGIFVTLAFLVIYLTSSILLFGLSGIVVQSFEPLLALVLCYVGAVIYNYAVVERERKQVRSTFSRFVSADVVNSLLESTDGIKLGGENREIVVFFSDICGFTSLSEQMEPEDVVEMLNHYFTEMTEIIFQYDGTVNKYIGDAIMAFYGAPVAMENPSEHAVRACLAMREALKRFNEMRTATKKATLAIGMGLHKGSVLVGNIGSPRQMEYTVIGDAVNVGSRIEGLTRTFETDLLISDSVYTDVSHLVEVETQEPIPVKGRTEKIVVHKVLGFKESI